jgi:hypothetical protein
MNRNQKIAVAIGVALVVLSGLFPPYEGELAVVKGDNLRRHLGRHFLFAPPTPEYVNKAILGETASTPTGIYLARFRATVVLSEFVVQLSVIVITTAGMTLLLTNRRKQNES